MKTKLVRSLLTVAVATGATFGLTACSSDEPAPSQGGDTNTSQGEEVEDTTDKAESAEFIADMEEGVQIINDMIAENPDMTQIMLASDVEQPTQKYGLWVMPYYPSDAVQKYTMSIQIENGTDFYVTAISAETGKTWEMDQAGNMREAAAE